jgi:hypothetical protein
MNDGGLTSYSGRGLAFAQNNDATEDEGKARDEKPPSSRIALGAVRAHNLDANGIRLVVQRTDDESASTCDQKRPSDPMAIKA